jgi:protein TonB
MSELVLSQFFPYGAPELKQFYQRFMTKGLIIAAILHLTGIASYHAPDWLRALGLLGEEPPPMRTVRIMKYSELGPPPSITNTSAAPAISVAAPSVRPSVGIPVPVPDAEINPEQTIATQTEMAEVGPVVDVGDGGSGGVAVIESDIKIEEDGPPPDFVAFEKAPEVVKQVQPKYPELARRAGMEGTVFVRVWVDKEGKVRKVEIQKSDAEIFNQPAVEAAEQMVFTPAVQGGSPVSVWVAMPFKFKLNAK